MASPDDPVLAACKRNMSRFRMQELRDVLDQLGLSKKGRKQDLVDRVMALLSSHQDQEVPKAKSVVKIVEDTFRKMQEPTNTVAASRSKQEPTNTLAASRSQQEPTNTVAASRSQEPTNTVAASRSQEPSSTVTASTSHEPTNTVAASRSQKSGHRPKKKPGDSAQAVKVRCPCGDSKPNDSMIKCIDPKCNKWQHVGCVIIPDTEKSVENISPELPSSFYCEVCRLKRADPFWVTEKHLLLPVLIGPSTVAADGSYTVQYTTKSFQLSAANREILQQAECDIQVWCILLNDKVPFRMHWPLHSDMQVNGSYVRVVNRQPQQKLGANGRDDGPLLTDYLKEGTNKISLSRNDSRTFCMGIRITKRRSLIQVLSLVPKEQDGENFDDALARVRRCVGGGAEANNADSDSDIEVVADSVSVNLRCPMTASRIQIAGRFKPCAHMGCFDLEAFIEINQRSRKWQCPICLKNYCLQNIIIDPYFNRITSLIKSCGDDTSEIDVKPDGSWRVKGGAELKDLIQWHQPDGTLSVVTDTPAKPEICTVKHEDKEEPLSEEVGRLKLGFKKKSNGQWEISKMGDADLVPSSGNDKAATNGDPTTHVHDLDSSSSDENGPLASTGQDIIVLSDSDDDDVMVLSPCVVNCGSAHDTGNVFPRDDPTSQIPETSKVENNPANDQSKQGPVSGADLGVAANLVENGNGLTSAKIASKKRSNPGDRITALDASLVGSKNKDERPFSTPQQRSVRPRVIEIDSDSD